MIETIYTLNAPISIAVLADFHNGDPETVISSLQKRHPHMITIVGDIVYAGYTKECVSCLDIQKNVLRLLNACVSFAPTYLSLGNHECIFSPADLLRISETGVTVLDNRFVSVTLNGATLSVGGLTSAQVLKYRRNKNHHTVHTNKNSLPLTSNKHRTSSGSIRTDLSWLNNFTHSDGFHILLSHHPEYHDLLPPVDLLLCGHAHGGQFRLGNRGLFAPGQGIFPTYTKGVYHKNMVVSAGLTNTARIPRINNPTEIVYITP